MSAKHTPGPWIALGLLAPFGWVIKHIDKKDGKESIAYIQAYDIEDDDPEPYGKWTDESKANHDLVLAAPDLLEALQSATACGMVPLSSTSDGGASKHSEQVRVADMIRAAIAKALGETS